MSRRFQFAGFSLLELLIVVSIMGILAALAMPSMTPGVHEQLQAVAQTIASDLGYARSLAVANSSLYRCSFDPSTNSYVLRHSGSNPALDELPPLAVRSPSDLPHEQWVRLADLPHLGGSQVRLWAFTAADGSLLTASSVEFGPLGETTRSGETHIWIAAGRGAERRFLPIQVDPVTGLAALGKFTSSGPAEAK